MNIIFRLHITAGKSERGGDSAMEWCVCIIGQDSAVLLVFRLSGGVAIIYDRDRHPTLLSSYFP